MNRCSDLMRHVAASKTIRRGARKTASSGEIQQCDQKGSAETLEQVWLTTRTGLKLMVVTVEPLPGGNQSAGPSYSNGPTSGTAG